MKWISTAVVVLLLSSLSVAAQTVTGYCMKYDQRHWLYQKDGQVNVIDMDIEWPMAASNADITPLQTFLAQEAFGLESKNYNDILPSFLQRFGEPVTKKFETIPAAGGDTPDLPDTPDTPDDPQSDNLCKWDNVDHGTSFWGRLVKFFHSILYFFAHLFGRR
jgi:hypothetical protein